MSNRWGGSRWEDWLDELSPARPPSDAAYRALRLGVRFLTLCGAVWMASLAPLGGPAVSPLALDEVAHQPAPEARLFLPAVGTMCGAAGRWTLVGEVGGEAPGLATDGAYVYLAIGPRIAVFDSSGSGRLTPLMHSPVFDAAVESLDVVGPYLVASVGSDQVWLRVRDEKLEIVQAVPDYAPYTLTVRGETLYTVWRGGLDIFKLSGTALPTLVSQSAIGETGSFAVNHGYLYLGSGRPDVAPYTSHLSIYDVRDPTEVQLLAQLDESGLLWTFRVRAFGDYLLLQRVNADARIAGICVYSIADPLAPRSLSCAPYSEAWDVFANHLWEVTPHGVDVYDLSNPNAVSFLTAVDCRANAVAGTQDGAYLATTEGCWDPAWPPPSGGGSGSATTTGGPPDYGSGGALRGLTLAPSGTLAVAAWYDTPNEPTGLTWDGERLIVRDESGDRRFWQLDISDPAEIHYVGQIAPVADSSEPRDPAMPPGLPCLPSPFDALASREIVVFGNYLYLNDHRAIWVFEMHREP